MWELGCRGTQLKGEETQAAGFSASHWEEYRTQRIIFLRWLCINAAAGLRRTSIFGRCVSSIVQFCHLSVHFCHVPSTQYKTSSEDGNFSGLVLLILTKALFLVPCFPLPLLSSSLLLLSWLGAGLLLAGRRHEVVWEQLLADRIHELVIKRSPETFFCSPQSTLLSRSLLPCVYHRHSKQSGKGVRLECFHLKKKKGWNIWSFMRGESNEDGNMSFR